MKISLLLIMFLLLPFCSEAQTPKSPSNAGKVCIDTVQSKNLIGTWYDFSPNFYVEQPYYIIYYVKNHRHISDSTSYNGTISFKSDGTFEKVFSTYQGKITLQGTWRIPPGTRELRLLLTGQTAEQQWTILELNSDIFILKLGK